MENQVLLIPSKPPSPPTGSLKDLINEWLTRFAINADKTLDAKSRAVYLSTWLEGFADVEPERLKAAFIACLRSHTYQTIPTIGDVRQHLQKAESNATNAEAEQAWQRVLEIYRVHWCPDMPGGFTRGAPALDERTWQAARAAGVFRDHESVEALHVWAKKQFLESFIRYGELEQEQFLLPDELKNLLADVAETKALPAPAESYAEMRARGLEYSEKLKAEGLTPDIQRAMREVMRESVPRPPIRSLEEQKAILRNRGFKLE